MVKNKNPSDIPKRARRRRNRKRFYRLAILLAILGAGLFLYYFRDSWLPWFSGMEPEYYAAIGGIETVTKGFPLKSFDAAAYQMKCAGNYFVCLNESNLYIYSFDGRLLDLRAHEYQDSLLDIRGKRVLVYEHGGKKFCVDNKSRTLYEGEASGGIIFARLSEEGYAAVVSTSESYLCEVSIYDPGGKEIYKINQTGRVFDVCFTESSLGLVTVSFDAKGGEIVSEVQRFDFGLAEPVWTRQDYSIFPLNVYWNTEYIYIIGDDKYIVLNDSGDLIKQYEYPYGDKLDSYSFDDGTAAIILRNEQKQTVKLVILDAGDKMLEVACGMKLRKSQSVGDEIYLMFTDEMKKLDINGTEIAAKQFSGMFSDFSVGGDKVFLKGNGIIEQLTFDGRKQGDS
jgi:hypothetical protein